MASVEAGMKNFHGNSMPMAKVAVPKTDIGTAAIMPIEYLEQSMCVKLDNRKSTGLYLTKAREKLMMTGAKARETVEVESAIGSFSAYTKVSLDKMGVTLIEEKMLALEKVVRKSLRS